MNFKKEELYLRAVLTNIMFGQATIKIKTKKIIKEIYT